MRKPFCGSVAPRYEVIPTDGYRLTRELTGLFLIFTGLLLLLSITSFDPRDPSLNHVLSKATAIHNKAGIFGAYCSGFLVDLTGVGAYTFPAFFLAAGGRRILGTPVWAWWRWFAFSVLGCCLSVGGSAWQLGLFAVRGGGLWGHILYDFSIAYFSVVGTAMVWGFITLLAVQTLFGFSWLSLARQGSKALLIILRQVRSEYEERREQMRAAAARRAKTKEASSAFLEREQRIFPDRQQDAPDPQPERDGSRRQAAARRFFFPWKRSRNSGNNDITDASPSASPMPPVSRDPLIRVVTPAPVVSEVGQASIEIASQADEDMLRHMPPSNPDISSSGEDSGESLDFLSATLDDSEPPWLRDLEEGKVEKLAVRATPAARRASIQEKDQPGARNPLARSRGTGHAAAHRDTSEDLAGSGGAQEASTPQHEYAGENREERQDEGEELSPKIQTPVYATPVSPAEHASVLDREDLDRAEDSPAEKESGGSVAAGPASIPSAPDRPRKRAPLPSLDILHAVSSENQGTPHHILEEKGNALMTCLADFGIHGELSAITPGPVVTMFEVRPAPGVKVSRIANLSDDLALALKAIAVRIQAPIPGSDVVGIEIPNENRETVCLKELFSSEAFQGENSLLTMALGKDIAGRPVSADLARMPHLLVAGATGAGKSVCLNSILLSFLYKARPEEVKLLLVDPKRIEMAVYADLPHLVHPVVTEMALAKNALEWAVSEMDERYKAIGRLKCRNIATYNERLAELGPERPEELRDLAPMPYLVIIIDELADLMLTAAKEVETSIVRLAQLARAAGIHMILATQRPSVDVVTGLIKANFPCRIAFQVTSKHDSRTILDAVGAEHLLGKGDMLFKPGGGKFRRLHGAFVSDDDVAAVTDYWRRCQKPNYAVDFSEWGSEAGDDVPSGGGSGLDDVVADPVYADAVEFVCQQGKASISLIQRRFRIGFNRAARFVEQMEKDGLIGPADGSKPRTVVRGKREE